MVQTLFEKLCFKEDKNIVVQGLPYSIERSFVKIKFSRNVTPLLKKNKIDFALLFAIDKNQLEKIVPEVVDVMSKTGKLWIAFPKKTSKILSNLSKNEGWYILNKRNYRMVRFITIDHVWSAVRFEKKELVGERVFPEGIESAYISYDKEIIDYPEDLKLLFEKFTAEQLFFESLAFDLQIDLFLWIESATNISQREQRLKLLIEKLQKEEFTTR